MGALAASVNRRPHERPAAFADFLEAPLGGGLPVSAETNPAGAEESDHLFLSRQRADLHIPSLDQPSLPTQWWQ